MKEKAINDVHHAKEAAEEANVAIHLAVASGATTRQAMASREAFTDLTWLLSPPP